MAEFDVDLYLSQPDELTPDEFESQFVAVEALIDEAIELDNENLLSIYEEKLGLLETCNPNAANRLKQNRLSAFNKSERSPRFMAAQAMRRISKK